MMTKNWRLICLAPGATRRIKECFYLDRPQRISLLKQIKSNESIQEVLILSTLELTQVLYLSEVDESEFLIQEISNLKSKVYPLTRSLFRKVDDEKKALTYFIGRVVGLNPGKGFGHPLFVSLYDAQQDAKTYLSQPLPYSDQLMVSMTKLEDRLSSDLSPENLDGKITLELVLRFVQQIKDPRIAIIGLNPVSKDILEKLTSHGHRLITVIQEKGYHERADRNDAFLIKEPLENLRAVIAESDIIINTLTTKKMNGFPLIHIEGDVNFKIMIDMVRDSGLIEILEEQDNVVYFNALQVKIEAAMAQVEQRKFLLKKALMEYSDWMKARKANEMIKGFENMIKPSGSLDILGGGRPQKTGYQLSPSMIEKLLKKSILKINQRTAYPTDISYYKLVNRTYLNN